VEAELRERFSTSRANVRNALAHLTVEGLVERIQNSGARVRAVSLHEAVEIAEVQMVLEAMCAAKAAEYATDDDRGALRDVSAKMREAASSGDVLTCSDLNRRLHALVLVMSRQSIACAVLERLRGFRHQFRLDMNSGRPNAYLPQHLAIIDALCTGDPDAAETAMRTHLRSVVEALREVEKSRPRYAKA
jgi:DNA-binding GntR family transcriptional regulator